MKLCYIFFLALFFTASLTSNALSIDTLPRKKPLSRIRLINGDLLTGYIVYADDSSIHFARKKDWKKQGSLHTESIPAERISGITKYFKNGLTTGEGILIGGLTGIALWVSVSLADRCDDPDGDCDFDDRLFSAKSLKTWLVFAGILGVAGMFVGIFSKKKQKLHYDINGERENIKKNKIGLTF